MTHSFPTRRASELRRQWVCGPARGTQRHTDLVRLQGRAEHLDEVEHEAAQIGVCTQRDVRRARLEEMADVAGTQLRVVLRIHGDRSQDGDAQPKLHVGLADIRIDRVEQYARSEEHTYELPSLTRTPDAVFCLKKKNK